MAIIPLSSSMVLDALESAFTSPALNLLDTLTS
jgi:hypothetical protein